MYNVDINYIAENEQARRLEQPGLRHCHHLVLRKLRDSSAVCQALLVEILRTV